MGRRYKTIVIGLFILYAIILVVMAVIFQNSSYHSQSFSNTLTINSQTVTKITISSPVHVGQYKTTANKEKINELINYLSQFKYKRMLNDQTAYMPTQASIIYFFDDTESSFIIPYGNEAMISQKVYKVKNGDIEKDYLNDYYNSL